MAGDAKTSAGAARVNQFGTASCAGGGPDSTKVAAASDGLSAPRRTAPKETATDDRSVCARTWRALASELVYLIMTPWPPPASTAKTTAARPKKRRGAARNSRQPRHADTRAQRGARAARFAAPNAAPAARGAGASSRSSTSSSSTDRTCTIHRMFSQW